MLEDHATSGPIRIILIDDNPDDRALVERELKLRIEDVDVVHIGDAAGLAEALDGGRFDVAVTDYRLRWTVGTEVLREIKGRYPQTPVIMFTGSGNEEVAVEAMKQGLDDYITKTPKHYPRVPYAVLGCFERASNRVKLQQALARESLAKTRLEIALQSAGMGTWQVDLGTGTLSSSDDVGPMFGLPSGQAPDGIEDALDRVHPDDRTRVRGAWAAARDDGAELGIEFRVQGADARTRWIAVSGKVVRDDGGRHHLVIGTARDVTADVADKERQRKQQEELQTILDVLPVGVAISQDPAARHIATTPYLADLLGAGETLRLDPQDGEALPYRFFRGGQPVAPGDWPMRVAARLRHAVRGDELEVRFADGRALTVLVNAAPLLDTAGETRGVVAAIMDVSALKDVQRALEEANRQKNEFLSVLAHELRNPMSAIGYSVEMLRHVALPEAIDKAREVIGRQTSHMSRLLDDLLDLSRITYNRIELDRRPLDIRRTIELAYESTRALIESLGQSIQFDLPATPVTVLGDEVRLTQVMSNLLNNAAKFTPAAGRITVRAAVEGGRAVVTVSDTGSGIEPAQLERIFDMFSQGQSKVSGGTAGLGIGLAVVRRIVDLHGGSVTAFSDGAGCGATLRVELPCADTAEPPQPLPSMPVPTKQARFLVADDNIDAADLLAAVLRLEGYAVQVAYDGGQAIDLAREWQPDVLILDIGMPLANGLEVARWVRRQDWGKRPTLVAVTGWGQEGDRHATREAGFDIHLVKPVSPLEILRIATQPPPVDGQAVR